MSSFPLTNSIIFQRGRLKPPTRSLFLFDARGVTGVTGVALQADLHCGNMIAVPGTARDDMG